MRTMNDMNDEIGQLARQACADLPDSETAAAELATRLREDARARGLTADEFVAEIKRETLEKYGDESEWWKIDV